MKRFLAAVLALVMTLSMLPVSALADEYLILDETVPVETIPEETIPEETIPEETIPEETIPEETIPEEVIPEETVPEETIPEETIPEETIPEETIPEETIPEETIPEETIPEETIPEETIPEETIPEETIPQRNTEKALNYCGENVTWTYANEVLTISGTGPMYDYTEEEEGRWPYYVRGTVIIEEGVTHIGEYAFNGNFYIKSVSIPSTVQSIGKNAFSGCSKLARVDISDLKAWCEMDTEESVLYSARTTDGLYLNGEKLTNVVIPEGVTFIRKNAFSYSNITGVTIPDTVTYIDSYAFYDTDIQKVAIPEGITHISYGTFGYCSSLTTVSLPSTLKSIGSAAFISSGLRSIDIPDGVETIERSAFHSCTALQSVNLSATVKQINSYAFSNCWKLKSIHIPGLDAWCGINFEDAKANPLCNGADLYIDGEKLVELNIPEGTTIIGNNTFSGCAFTAVTIPATVTSIGDYAFANCTMLERVSFSGGVESIGEAAFEGCTSLGHVTLPEGLKTMGYGAFRKCTCLTTVSIPSTLEGIPTSAFRECQELRTVSIDEGIRYINSYAFYGNISLELAILPDTVTHIGASAFEQCSKLQAIGSLKNVTNIGTKAFCNCAALTDIGTLEQITIIGDNAFQNCSALTEVIISGPLEKINQYAFDGCAALESVKNSKDCLTAIGAYAFNNCISLEEAGTFSVLSTLGDYAFNNCASLKAVEIGGDLTAIGQYAFYGCNSMTVAEIPDDVTTIGNYAFYGCENLQDFAIPTGLTTLGEGAFGYCLMLQSADIPDTVTTIPAKAFYACISLEEITWSSDLTSIGSEAFTDCISLRTIDFPDTVTVIGDYAFCDCVSLTQIDLPSSLTFLGEGAIAYCTGLTNLVIPSGVKTLHEAVFYGAVSLVSVTLPAELKTINNMAFNACGALNHILYTGSQEQWNSISVHETNNAILAETVIHCEAKGDEVTAGLSDTGVYASCTICDSDIAFSKIDISKCVVNFVNGYNEYIEYTGSSIRPELYVIGPGGVVLEKGVDYKVSYKNNKNIGIAQVVVTGIGDYTGSTKLQFAINVPQVKNLRITSVASKSFKIAFNKVKGADKYAIYADGELYAVTSGNTYTLKVRQSGNGYDVYVVALKKAGEYYYASIPSEEISGRAYNHISKYNIKLDYTETVYNGRAKKPGYSSTEGLERTIVYENNIEIGTATVTITGRGQYGGTVKKTFKILPDQVKNLNVEMLSGSSVNISFDPVLGAEEYWIYRNGERVKKITETSYTMTGLSAGKTYKFYVKANTPVNGENYTGAASETVSVKPVYSMEDCTLQVKYATKAYTGKSVTNTFIIKNPDGKKLEKDEDYKVTYENNKNIGTATATITGKGKYAGTLTATFDIVPPKMSTPKVKVEQMANGTALYVTFKDVAKAEWFAIYLNGELYTKTGEFGHFTEYLEPGSYRVTVAAGVTIDGKDYIGAVSDSVKVTARHTVANCNVVLDQTEFVYTGKSHKPAVTVYGYDGEVLTEGEDYTVSYKNNKSTGKGYALITGKGNYNGTAKAYFTINPAQVTGVKVSSTTKNSVKISFKKASSDSTKYYGVYVDGQYVGRTTSSSYTIKGLELGKTYDVYVIPEKTVSGATYYGQDSQTITVWPGTGIGEYKVTLEYTKAVYTGEAFEPAVTVKTSSKSSATTLVEGVDYIVTYENNAGPGKAKVIIQGIGGYTGTITKTFTITPGQVTGVTATNLSKTEIQVSFEPVPGATAYWVYVNGKVKVKTAETDCEISGLKRGSTYKITVKAVATVDGANYSGTLSETCKITAREPADT